MGVLPWMAFCPPYYTRGGPAKRPNVGCRDAQGWACGKREDRHHTRQDAQEQGKSTDAVQGCGVARWVSGSPAARLPTCLPSSLRSPTSATHLLPGRQARKAGVSVDDLGRASPPRSARSDGRPPCPGHPPAVAALSSLACLSSGIHSDTGRTLDIFFSEHFRIRRRCPTCPRFSGRPLRASASREARTRRRRRQNALLLMSAMAGSTSGQSPPLPHTRGDDAQDFGTASR